MRERERTQEYSVMFGKLQIRTYESHDYRAIDEEAGPTKSKQCFGPMPHLTRDIFVGKDITEHKICGEVVGIATRAKQISSQIPSPVLEEHRVHMAAQVKK